jgi:DNA-binding beta-propeller fold protein YncE
MSPASIFSLRAPACALVLLIALVAGCGDDDSCCRIDDTVAPSPTPTRAPRNIGPGLGNLTYSEDELFTPVAVLQSPRGHGNAAMVAGYLMVIYSSDGGGRSGDGGIDLWDVSDPRAPALFKRYDDLNTHGLREAHGFGFSNDYAFDVLVAQSEEGIQFYDVTDPNGFTLVSQLELPNINGGDYAGVWWVFFQAPYVYAAGVGEGLYVIDAADPLAPQVVNWIATSDIAGMSPVQVYAVGNLLVLTAHESDRIVTFDISDPVRPRLLVSGKGAFGYSHLFAGGQVLTSGGPQLESVLPILDGGEPVFAPRTLGITDIGHDGSITFKLHGQEAGLDQGGYGSAQDGYFFGGFSKQVAKFDLADGTFMAMGSTDIDDTDEDFGLVLGNLIWGGDDHGRGSGLFPHQTEPDSIGPAVTWIHPADSASNVAPTARIGVSMSDNVDIYSVDSSTFSVARSGQPPLPGKYSVQMGLVNFSPEQPLQANETYEVRINGIRDLAGNTGPSFASTFTTGTRPLPSCRLANADEGLAPVAVGTPVDFAPLAVTGDDPRFSWDFGDGTSSAQQTARHAYANPGRHNVVLTVQDRVGRSSCSAVQIVYNPPSVPPPTAASTIAWSDDRVFCVHPDNDAVSALDAIGLNKLWQAPVGDNPRTLAIAPDGNIWTANQDDATLSVISRADGALLNTIALPYASQPYGVAFAPDGSALYVALQATREILELNLDGSIAARLALGGKPRGVAVTGDSRHVLVTRFLSPANEGQVWRIDAHSFAAAQTIGLHFDVGPDTEESGRGVPNFLTSIRISPDGRRAVVPSKKDNIARGLYRDGQELDFESRVRTIVSQIDLDTGEEIAAARIDLNDRDMAQSAVFSPLGDIFFAATQGTNTIEIVDTYRAVSIGTLVASQFEEIEGFGRRVNNLTPQGLAIDPAGARLFAHNFLSRSISVYDVAAVVKGVRNSAPLLREIRMIPEAQEKLPLRVLVGKRIFYNASDPRMSRDGYLSCASCHVDGTHDGQVWDFTQVGEGLRNTIDLTGRAGTGHGNLHWTANFDEIQDFENDIRTQFSGTGLMRDDRFEMSSDPLGPTKAGRSNDLDSLAVYVASLTEFADSPHRNPDGTLTAAGERGKQLFLTYDCDRCHAGDAFTDGQRHDVGTIRPSSGLGIGMALAGVGFETPTLKGIWDTAPYLHDGSAATLLEVLDNATHVGQPLRESEREDLVAYLLQIDGGEAAGD